MKISSNNAIWLVFFTISLSLFTGLLSPTAATSESRIAANTLIVSGVIQNVSDDDIVVNDRRYTITGVPIFLPSGQPATASDVKQGNMADIYFQNGSIIKILIHEPLPA